MTKEEMTVKAPNTAPQTPQKYIFGTVKVGEKGQICIPKAARDLFGLVPGSSLLVVGDSQSGIALITDQALTEMLGNIAKGHSLPLVADNPQTKTGE